MRKVAIWSLLVLLTACGTIFNAATPQDNIRKGIIGFHDGIYIPTMQELGARYDRGDQWVVAHEPRIEQLSQQYVQIKTEIGVLLNTNADTSTITAKLQLLLAIVTELQQIQGGK